jgi:hypothetical protein
LARSGVAVNLFAVGLGLLFWQPAPSLAFIGVLLALAGLWVIHRRQGQVWGRRYVCAALVIGSLHLALALYVLVTRQSKFV